ncbi:replicative DNA helicase [Candidatus Saccharibacteria bacterium]|nr:replicative DNA helicase [Candidatus Saccharibacteria bacterium]
MDPKIPPQNIEAEMSLLGSILLDSESLVNIADIVEAEDFYENRHEHVYRAIMQQYEKRRPIDVLTVSNRLRDESVLEQAGGSSYLTELVNGVPTAAHAAHYAEIVAHKSTLRRLIGAAEDITRFGFDEATPMQEVLENAERRLFSVSQRSLKQDIISLESILADSFDRLDELHKDKGQIRGVPTGFTDLDNTLAGLQKSDLIILAARPSMGKTSLAMNITQNIAVQQKVPVLFFSLEMSKEQLVDRLLAAEADIDAWALRTGKLRDEDFERLGHAMGSLSEAPIYIDDTPSITALEMRTKARREAQKHPLGLIVVDYLQLMSSGSGTDNRVQEISEISRGLKALGRELNVPVLALSQLSRSVESRTPQIPQLSDLRESGSIEQDADVVLFIYREDYYNPETERQNLADILIKKHRNGPTGTVEMYFNKERVQFQTIDRKHSQG